MRKIFSTLIVSVLLVAGFSIPSNAVDTRTCALGGPCAVGDVGPGGGVVFYARTPGAFTDSISRNFCVMPNMCSSSSAQVDMTSTQVSALTFDYLEFAPASGLTSLKQASADSITITSSSFGAGITNTNSFISAFPNDNSTNNASHWANNYASNGKEDWFLPSRDELATLMIRYYKDELGPSSPLSGSFYTAWSSENQTIFRGDPYYVSKSYGSNSTNSFFVIPIRAFSSTPVPTAPTPAAPTPATSDTPVITETKVTASSKIKFDRSSSTLSDASKAKLKKLAATVGSGAEITAMVSVGRLDGVTSSQMKALAKLRAKAISEYLKSIIDIDNTYKVKIIDSGIKPVTTIKAN